MKIPFDRLPPGFAERVDDPPSSPALTKPAATVVLVRDGVRAPEILLLKRLRSAGFVPGAYVFPGGRVDDADAEPELLAMLPHIPEKPEPAYWLAAVREVFEETGVLLASGAYDARAFEQQREALLSGGATLLDVMRALSVAPDLSGMVYCAHWITPVAEPKRYDTRFFLAALPDGAEATADPREMSDAVWLTADDALQRFRDGSLPMVFPTVKTIERLARYTSVEQMLSAFRGADIPGILPRLVRLDDGIGIVMP
jgi:recombination protein RecT